MKSRNILATNVSITAIRTNGSPISQNFHVAVEADTDKMIATVQQWAKDRSYGGIVRVFMNREQPTEGASVSRTYEFEDVDDFAYGMKLEFRARETAGLRMERRIVGRSVIVSE